MLRAASPTPDPARLRRADLLRLHRQRLEHLLNLLRRAGGFYGERLAGVPAALLGPPPPAAAFAGSGATEDAYDAFLDELAGIPLTARADLEADQRASPPYGTNLTEPLARYVRLHQTSGSGGAPLRWLDTAESWAWWKRCWTLVYRAAGLAPTDRLLFPFSFGPFIGFWSAFETAADLGNAVLPAGGMTTNARLRYLLDNDVTVVCCTPTYALHMAEAAHAQGLDLARSRVRLLIVAGEPGGGVPATRARIESAWGARLIDHAGMTEIGAWGCEPLETPGVMHVNEAEFIAEVIDPATLRRVADGQCGELILTNLGRLGSPLVRYRTGDLVRLTRRGASAWGCFARLDGGVLGRTDDLLFVRGNNVFPSAIEGILREFESVVEFRLALQPTDGLNDLLTEVEPRPAAAGPAVAERLTAEVRDRLNFRPIVSVVPPGALPRYEFKARRIRKDE